MLDTAHVSYSIEHHTYLSKTLRFEFLSQFSNFHIKFNVQCSTRWLEEEEEEEEEVELDGCGIKVTKNGSDNQLEVKLSMKELMLLSSRLPNSSNHFRIRGFLEEFLMETDMRHETSA